MIAASSPDSGLTGHQLMARQFVSLIAGHWPNSKVKATAVGLSESQLRIGAWHLNKALITDIADDVLVLNVETGEPTIVLDGSRGKIRLSGGDVVTVPTTTLWVVSKDCGLFQISISASRINSGVEANLRTDATDEDEFMMVARENIEAAYRKWTEPWTRNGKSDYRRWQPWFGYTDGWAMFPEAWIWHQLDGVPVGPWQATGRYLHKAIRGVANWHLLVAKDMDSKGALAEGERLATNYGVEHGDLFYHPKSFVTWKYPPIPPNPPSDGVGPRPAKNSGV